MPLCVILQVLVNMVLYWDICVFGNYNYSSRSRSTRTINMYKIERSLAGPTL